ncbi:lysine--tRNA ligase [Elusimicrobiota bacterium]
MNKDKELKIQHLKDAGIDLYPPRFNRTHKAQEVYDLAKDLEIGARLEDKTVIVAGRIMQMRSMGKTRFFHVKDSTGKIQIYMRKDELADTYPIFSSTIEVGDIVGIEGFPFKTKTGEPSVHAKKWSLLSKSLNPPPEKWHGLKDTETRYRQRYLDLMSSSQIASIFGSRAKIIDSVRNTLNQKGFTEVETPVFQIKAGGAAAKPFTSFHNALETDLFLRIATELYLKRLIVGDMEKVYEIGKCFRNEGIDTQHNPEFTMLEVYEAYNDYEGMAKLTTEIINNAQDSLGKPKMTFERVSLPEEWKKATGEDLENLLDDPHRFNRAKLKEKAAGLQIKADEAMPTNKIFDKIMDTCVIPKLGEAVFMFDYPTAISPLAKSMPGKPHLVERFELFIKHAEAANAFTELNDPAEQRKRMEVQASLREEEKDEEAPPVDDEFINALEYAMPPTGGLGIGIDRLVMALLDIKSIREVILFPTLKPKTHE